jgi:hypothetical protein
MPGMDHQRGRSTGTRTVERSGGTHRVALDSPTR